ncbi:MAG: hypothetical protein V2I54_07445 [Bacteroidales bacterium]|jgi:hypothetical protein|nr:hypothetical protein [Bacteroidales bacterium]
MKIAAVLVVGLLLAGCTYDFSSDHFMDIKEPVLENRIRFHDFNPLDTINEQCQIRYSLEGNPDQEFVALKVFLDNNELSSAWQEREGGFYLSPQNYSDGRHTLRIESVYSSGTGSIADQAELEYIQETLEAQFIVHRNPSVPPAITGADIENGSITVRWEPINDPEYVNAFLSLRFKESETRIPLTHEMLDRGVYVDQSTVLFERNSNRPDYDLYSEVTYAIVYESEYTELYGNTQTVTCDPEWLALEVSYVDLDSYKIKWNKHPLYANFDSYRIYYASSTFYGDNQGGEYLVESPYVFGKAYSGSMSVHRNDIYFSGYDTYEMKCDEETFGLFDFKKLFSKALLYNPNNQNYYAVIIEDKIGTDLIVYVYKYSADFELRMKTEVGKVFQYSHDVLELALDSERNELYLDTDRSTYSIDPDHLTIINEFSAENSAVLKQVRGNILKTWDRDQEQITLHDLETNTLIYSGDAVDQGTMSPNGEYVYINSGTERAVYNINNHTLDKRAEVNVPSHDFLLDDDLLFYISYDVIYIVDLVTGGTRSFPFGGSQQVLQYDTHSQKLIASQWGSHRIYDLATDQLISVSSESSKSNPGTFGPYDDYYYLWIVNGKLIHSKGIYVDLD